VIRKSRYCFLGLCCAFCVLRGELCKAEEPVAAAIDRLVTAAQTRDKVRAAPLADDAEFIRRLYLDLIGRIPTREEAQRFCGSKDASKRDKLIDILLSSGELAKHWRENFHVLLMGGPAFTGNPEWRGWLETALRQNKGWDVMAREMLRARADEPENEGASQFLLSRFAQGGSGLDLATRDVSRFFFGVDIQCARCHKHPEVKQWKQESYWGMAAFLNRSYPITVKGKLYLAEKATGELEFTPKNKKPTTAGPVYLTGAKLDEPPPKGTPQGANAPRSEGKDKAAPAEDPADYLVAPEAAPQKTCVPVPRFSRRDKLVKLAINAKDPYFKRSAVNLTWKQLLGRGLVEPIDQMHNANPASHPELLQLLADDFATHQFDLRRLIRGIVTSQTYQRTSRHPADSPRPAEQTYACAAVRPLSAHQLALSILTAAGYLDVLKSANPKLNPGELRAKLETQHAGLLATLVKELDSGADSFQPGIREALFQANNATFADILAKGGLPERLAAMTDDDLLVKEAFWSVLSRLPDKEESERLRGYLAARRDRRAAACEQIVWSLVTSTEFRFTH
jgi:hypothetical protein